LEFEGTFQRKREWQRHAVTLALIVLVLATSHTQIVQAVDSVIDGNIVFTGPGQGGAKDIRTTTTDGGLRIYNGSSLNPIPTGAAIQFFGNNSVSYLGQAFIDSGAHDNAAIIFRAAPNSLGITERMRITSDGNVGIGTTTPNSDFQVVGDFIQIPTTTSFPDPTTCDEASELGRMILKAALTGPPVDPTLLYVCTQVGSSIFWFGIGAPVI
jgi:hypothetical protein